MVPTLVADVKDPLCKWLLFDPQGEVSDESETP